MAQVLATSRYATDLLEREPQGVRMLGEQETLEPLTREALQSEMLAAARAARRRRRRRWRAIRAVRRRELLRISVADLLRAVRRGRGRLRAAPTSPAPPSRPPWTRWSARSRSRAASAMPTRMAIVAMGRYGGFELSLRQRRRRDVRARPAARTPTRSTRRRAPRRWPTSVRRLLLCPARDPALEVDADLRPEGKQGPLVRTLDSYAAYYAQVVGGLGGAGAAARRRRSSATSSLRRRFTRADRPAALPGRGAQPTTTCVEVRRIKARVDDERLPRGADPADPPQARARRAGRHRVDRAAAADAARRRRCPELRTTRTLEALRGRRRARPARPRRRRRRWPRPGGTASRAAQRDHPGAGQARRPAAPRRPRAGRGGAAILRLPAGRVRRRWSTTTCASPGAPARSSTGCSGHEADGFMVPRNKL